jgi:hypothetical protein
MRFNLFMNIVILLSLLLVPTVSKAAEDISVKITASPEISSIGPDVDLAKYTISVLDQSGEPIPYTKMLFTLDAPKKGWFFSTDFPLVEGTRLMESEVVLEDGTYTFDYIAPIRGEYQLNVKVSSTEKTPIAFSPQEKEITFHLNENKNEVVNAIILIAILIGIGIVLGVIFAKSRYREKAVI